jgi:biopolymer transport protein ExbD
MGAKLGGSEDDVMADINITPFVDIVLVVLIVFMIASVEITRQAIKVSLPEAATGETVQDDQLGITMLADGTMLVDGEPTTPEALAAKLDELRKDGSDVIVAIAADKTVEHGRVVWLMDFLRQHDAYKYAMNIDPTQMISPDGRTP